jgi:hypothetical protein
MTANLETSQKMTQTVETIGIILEKEKSIDGENSTNSYHPGDAGDSYRIPRKKANRS